MSHTPLPAQVVDVGHGFWNIRGSFKIALFDVGTQASLVRRQNGRYLLLDACRLSAETLAWVRTLTGDDLEAVLHLHPFHTVFAARLHAELPQAKLYGTARHHRVVPDLPWEPLHTEDPELHALFADDLVLSVPRGVDFIPEDENLHFASVLAFHPASRTLHVDDTLSYARLPWPVRAFKQDLLILHPTLAKVLERRAGAVADFRAWAEELVTRCQDVDNLCAAHSATLLAADNRGPSIAERVRAAVDAVDGKLAKHERRFG